jgi:hypothetical protein
MKRYDFDTLWLLEQTALFRADMRAFMKERWYPGEVVFAFSCSDATKEKSLIKLYQDYGRGEYREWFFKYLDDVILSWVESAKKQLNYLYNQLQSDCTAERTAELERTIAMHLETIRKYRGYQPTDEGEL